MDHQFTSVPSPQPGSLIKEELKAKKRRYQTNKLEREMERLAKMKEDEAR
jgi:hypothetical protein